MPWHQAPKKDVTSCEKLRGAANKPRSADVRMWEHTPRGVRESGGTQGTETSWYLEEEKVKQRLPK